MPENKEKKKMTTDIKIFIGVCIVIAGIIVASIFYLAKPKDIVSFENQKVNTEEFQFYYTQNYQTYYQYSAYYEDQQEFHNMLKEQTLQEVVEIQYLLMMAKQDGFKADANEINEEWASLEENLKQGASANNMSLNDFSKQSMGLGINKLKRVYKDYMTAQKYREQKIGEIAIDEEALAAFYEENKDSFDHHTVRHILVSCAEDAEEAVVEEKSKLAEEILDKVNNGEDFAALALEFSEDPGSKETGGVYEVTQSTNFVPEFKEWTFSHQAGETGIVKTEHGFHVMRLDAIYDSLESQREAVQNYYRYNQYQTQLNEALNSETYKVEILEAYQQF